MASNQGLSSPPDDAKKAVVNSLTLRRNFDLLYEQLEPSLLTPVLNRNISYAEKRGRVESYQEHRHAQNAAMIGAILSMRLQVNVSDICLALGGNNDQQRIAQTLLKDSQQLWCGQELQEAQLIGADVQSDFRELCDAFTTLFHDVKREFEQLPNGLDIIKQTLASLVLPLKFSGMVHIVPSSLYSEAKSIDEIFTNLSPFINPLSFYFLRSLVQLSDCTTAAEKIADFFHLRQTNSHFVLCSDQWAPPSTPSGLNDLHTVAPSGAKLAHLATLDHLQSFHSQIFAMPQEHEHPKSGMEFVQISAQLNMKVVSLSDYDAVVTAISGFFLLPKSALVYIGCSSRPLTLCWCVLKEIAIYMGQTPTHVNSELLLTEQGIVHIMIGDWVSYKCLTVEESRLLICAYYGKLEEAPDNIDLNVSNFNGWTALMLAAAQGQTTAVALLLSAGVRVDQQDKSGTTALFHACRHDNIDVVMLLLQASASIDIPTVTGDNPLHYSCDRGNVQIAQLLLQAHPNLDLPNNNGWTPLMKSSFENRDKVVQLLVNAGATLDLLHRIEGFTALHCACQQGHVNVVQVLVRAGANLDIQMVLSGVTPLMKATVAGHIEVVEILIDAGANVDLKDMIGASALYSACQEGHEHIVKLLIQAGASVNSQQPLTGVFPLHIVSDHGSAIIAQLLIEGGANVDISNSQGWTSLMKASFQGHNEVVELLLAAGANTDLKNQDGFTALACACQERQERAVQLLLRAKADINVKATGGLTALHKACGKDNVTIVKYLIAAGCNQIIDAQTTEGWTPLHHASIKDRAKIADLLIQAGANVNVQTKLGYTPLTMACEKGYLDVVDKLIKAEADVNLCDQDHRTALFWAAMKGQSNVAKALLQRGADANIKNKGSQSPFDIASISGHAEVCELLIEHGNLD